MKPEQQAPTECEHLWATQDERGGYCQACGWSWEKVLRMSPKPEQRDYWNKCDVCGRFIALDDFDKGAVRRCVYPDSELTRETWETLCALHAIDEEVGS